MKIPVVVIFAPTASGKTALALNIFGRSSLSCFKGCAELISADSMQVYKGVNIGTAKPSEQEQKELPHHLIDVCSIEKQFSAADFVSNADRLCSEIFSRNHIPVVAGGTGFYIKNFVCGLPKTPESDPKIRSALIEREKKEGREVLYKELCSVDAISAKKIHENDSYRILRALEVFYSTGKTRSSFETQNTLREKFDFTIIILERNRELLYERINKRVDMMIAEGLYEEVVSLVKNGATKDMPGMKGIGYSEWFLSDGRLRTDVENVCEEIKHNSRKYAKKQYTFIKGLPGAHIVNSDDEEVLYEEVLKILSKQVKVLH